MLDNPTIDKMHKLKLHGMLKSLPEITNNLENTNISISEAIGLLVDQEYNYRHNKKLNRLLSTAKLKFSSACVEDIDYNHPRQLRREQIKQVVGCQWIHNQENIVLTGPTGIGKTYLACAFANHACRLGFSARYFRLSKLLDQIYISHSDGSYSKLLSKLLKINLLIIDDWGIEPMNTSARNSILEIIDDRYSSGSVVISSQLPISNWHSYIDNDTIADAILDRIVNRAIKMELKGDSLRKQT